MSNEIIIRDTLVMEDNCLGCIRTKTDLMIVFSKKEDTKIAEYTNVFMTFEQADKLQKQLKTALSNNKIKKYNL